MTGCVKVCVALAAMGLALSGQVAPAMAQESADLGGGFIEFLFSGGRESQPAPLPGRQRGSGPVYVIDMGQGGPGTGTRAPMRDRYAYSGPVSAGQPAPEPQQVQPRFDPQFERQLVDYDGRQSPGTIVIDTDRRFLFLVQPDGKALRYGVGVGRAGFDWHGTKAIARKAEWPDWRPPADMRKRRPDLPVYMAGGPRNPLGARAMYLGGTLYRIHGSNEPQTIGHAVSSGCIRMRNEDVIDLYDRVGVGTKVVVL